MKYHDVRMSSKDIDFLMQVLRRIIDNTQPGDEAHNRSSVLCGRLAGYKEREARAYDRSHHANQRDSIARAVQETMEDTGMSYSAALAFNNVD